MKVHEYQGKELFRKYQIPTPNGVPVFSVEEALKAYDELATDDDGSCYKEGCSSDWADNYDEYATIDDESCVKEGCTSNLSLIHISEPTRPY